MTKIVNNYQGPSLLGLLGLIFITLKLCGVIDWSWWYVTMPFWGLAGLLLALITGGAVLAGIVLCLAACADFFINNYRRYKRRKNGT